MRLPSVLIPYPIAADDHQRHNANAFVETGAALLLEQHGATGDALAAQLLGLLTNAAAAPLREVDATGLRGCSGSIWRWKNRPNCNKMPYKRYKGNHYHPKHDRIL